MSFRDVTVKLGKLSILISLYARCSGCDCCFFFFIADFGFARHLVGADMAATLCGSPLYMVSTLCTIARYVYNGCHTVWITSLHGQYIVCRPGMYNTCVHTWYIVCRPGMYNTCSHMVHCMQAMYVQHMFTHGTLYAGMYA